jgi:regulator of protease activity HflC (stomatin/prohibitin superfamily)
VFDRLIQLVAEFAYLFRVWAIVHPYERVVVLRLGHFSRVLGPGRHWVWPLRIEETLSETVTPRTTNLPVQTVTTSDGVQVSVAALVTWEVSDVAKLLLESADHQEAMLDTAMGVVAQGCMSVLWSDLQGPEFARTLRSDIKRKARKWGIRVTDVQLTDLAKTRTYRVLQPLPRAGA